MTSYLQDRGFTEEIIERVGWRVEPLNGSTRRYGLPASAKGAAAWVIPYGQAFERIRLIDPADLERHGGGKYRQPAGQGLALYDPFGWLARDEPLDGLLLIEGEANAVAVGQMAPDLPVVGLPGQASLSEEMAGQLGDVPVSWVWIDRFDPGAERNLERIVARVQTATRGDVLPLAASAGMDANDVLLHLGAERGGQALRAMLQQARPAPRQAAPTDAERVSENRYTGRVLDVAALLAAPDTPVPWRCAGLAADGFLSVVAGRGGEGKSWLTLALACGVARGQDAAGIDCKKGRAILFDAENGAPLIARRLRAAGVTADMAVQPVEVGGLSFAKDAAWFRRIIDEHKPQLVIFDSLRVLSSGSKESDSDEMEPVITRLKQLARDTGCAIVLVHHRGKAEGSEYRGSSVILDQADLLFTLGRVAGDPEGRHRRKITTVKCRLDEEPAPRWVAIEADRTRGLVFVNEAEPYEADSSRPRDTLREDVLAKLTGISQSGARIARALGRGKADGTVRRVLDDLQADGLAEKRADGWGLPTLPTPRDMATGNPTSVGEIIAPSVKNPEVDDARLAEAYAYISALYKRGRDRRCSCERPLPAPDADGDLRCAHCGHACDGRNGAA